MSDLQDQLAQLRRKIARIDRKFQDGPKPPPAPPPLRFGPDTALPGRDVETPHGRHVEIDKLYERHRRHGSIGIADLEHLPPDLLGPMSGGQVPDAAPSRWAFLDTETTGLMGGAGTYAFLIGVGSITPEGFRLRQFFMREHSEEPSVLHALHEYLQPFDVLVTYNGRTYDQPLLETRYRLCRARPPFGSMEHLDLLFGARRLWKLRFDRCRLVDLENQILGVEREGDLPGELIPYVYFEYVRSRNPARVIPVLHHNATDILTLACLTAIVPWAFHAPGRAQFSHGAEMIGLGRWWRNAGNLENALKLFRDGLRRGLPDELLFRTLWDVASLEKKLGRTDAAIPVYAEIGSCRNAYQAAALEALAKHYEHRERNYTMAAEMTRSALEVVDSDQLRKRLTRLNKRALPAASAGRLL